MDVKYKALLRDLRNHLANSVHTRTANKVELSDEEIYVLIDILDKEAAGE